MINLNFSRTNPEDDSMESSFMNKKKTLKKRRLIAKLVLICFILFLNSARIIVFKLYSIKSIQII